MKIGFYKGMIKKNKGRIYKTVVTPTGITGKIENSEKKISKKVF